ncbi:Crp/Fnr family transcriptional regulator [Terriglobus roseus]|nr:Crp/Fnr family transcriptional regulator [Terriglobus roseus]
MPAPLVNRLLSSLSPEVRQSLERKLVSVPLPIRTPIYEPGREPKYSYFITSGIASVVTEMDEGSVVEVGLLGREAVPGSLLMLGAQQGGNRCFMQVGGTGLRIGFSDLVQEFRRSPEVHARILQQVQYEAFTLTQLSACNRLHEVEERLARWILMVSDRISDDVLPITHEFLGQMLGTRRSTVSMSAAVLQRAGFIEYQYGQIRILDRPLLESAACQCYPMMKRLHSDLYADAVSLV